MQHVTAFSSPQTVPAASARKPSLWILDSWRDLVLYVCTPLLIVPIFLLAQARWSAQDIYLFVAANDRYTRNLLFGRWTFHPACTAPHCAARVAGGGDRSRGIVPCKLRLVVDSRTATKSSEAGAPRHEHIFLVVLQ